jgi:hypothetical protein
MTLTMIKVTVNYYADSRQFIADATYKGSYFQGQGLSEDAAVSLLVDKIKNFKLAKGPEYPKKLEISI